MTTRADGERVAKLASAFCASAKNYRADEVLGALAGATAAMIGMRCPREKWDEELREFNIVVSRLLDLGFESEVLQ